MRLLFRFVLLSSRFIRRLATHFAVLALVVSLGFNVAMLTVSGVYAAAQGALSALGISTLVANEAGEKVAGKMLREKLSVRLAKRSRSGGKGVLRET